MKKEYLEEIIPKSEREYVEAAVPKPEKENIMDKAKDVIGKIAGWKITVKNSSGEIEQTVDYESNAMRTLKSGDMFLTDKDMKELKEGKFISPHEVISIDKAKKIIVIRKAPASKMGMINKSGNLGPNA